MCHVVIGALLLVRAVSQQSLEVRTAHSSFGLEEFPSEVILSKTGKALLLLLPAPHSAVFCLDLYTPHLLLH